MPLEVIVDLAVKRARKAGRHNLADLLLDQKWVKAHRRFVMAVANGSFFKELERHGL